MVFSYSRDPDDAIGRYIRPDLSHQMGVVGCVVIRSIGNSLHHDWGKHSSACCCCGHGQRHLTPLCLGNSWDPGSDVIGRCDRDLKLEYSSGCGGEGEQPCSWSANWTRWKQHCFTRTYGVRKEKSCLGDADGNRLMTISEKWGREN